MMTIKEAVNITNKRIECFKHMSECDHYCMKCQYDTLASEHLEALKVQRRSLYVLDKVIDAIHDRQSILIDIVGEEVSKTRRDGLNDALKIINDLMKEEVEV